MADKSARAQFVHFFVISAVVDKSYLRLLQQTKINKTRTIEVARPLSEILRQIFQRIPMNSFTTHQKIMLRRRNFCLKMILR